MNSNRCKRTAMYCVDGTPQPIGTRTGRATGVRQGSDPIPFLRPVAGVIKAMGISEGPGPEGQADPAGDDFPQS